MALGSRQKANEAGEPMNFHCVLVIEAHKWRSCSYPYDNRWMYCNDIDYYSKI